jgi:hypothetical protein
MRKSSIFFLYDQRTGVLLAADHAPTGAFRLTSGVNGTMLNSLL